MLQLNPVTKCSSAQLQPEKSLEKINTKKRSSSASKSIDRRLAKRNQLYDEWGRFSGHDENICAQYPSKAAGGQAES